MKKIYYIDSENVGESWIESLDKVDARFIIFYTKNSPRIAYPQVIQLMNTNKRPEFVECYKGNNGLDFQLVSYLGFELCNDQTSEMIIVSNDTGFDTVVQFWRDRGMNVKRISRSELIQITPTEQEAPVSNEECIANSSSVKVDLSHENVHEWFDIINCIGKNNSMHIYVAMTHFYGDTTGRTIYQFLKKEEFNAPNVNWDVVTRMCKFMNFILKYSNITFSVPDTFIPFMMEHIVDNPKMMIDILNQEYGNIGIQLHHVFKKFYKVLSIINN